MRLNSQKESLGTASKIASNDCGKPNLSKVLMDEKVTSVAVGVLVESIHAFASLRLIPLFHESIQYLSLVGLMNSFRGT